MSRRATLFGLPAWLVAYAATLFLIVNAFHQPGMSDGRRTTVGDLCAEIAGRARGTRCVFSSYRFAAPGPSGAWNELTDSEAFADPIPPGAASISRWRTHSESGFWSVVRHADMAHLDVRDAATGAPASVSIAQKIALLDMLDAAHPGEFPGVTRADDLAGLVVRTHALWPGVINDAAVVAGALVLVFSLVSIVRARRGPAHLCQRCAYDLRGLPSKTCPECGHAPHATT